MLRGFANRSKVKWKRIRVKGDSKGFGASNFQDGVAVNSNRIPGEDFRVGGRRGVSLGNEKFEKTASSAVG